MPLLVAAGAAVGGAAELELKPGWTEGPNLYAAIIGEPGSKKSPALRLAVEPLHRVQRRLAEQHEAASERYEAELATWEGQPRSERGPRPQAPAFPHVLTTNATQEALGPMLAASPGVLLETDELSGWVASMDQYRHGRGDDRQFFLKCWSRVLVKTDRRSSPLPTLVARPCLAVVGGIQPDLLADLDDPRGRHDGFTDRLLWS